MKVNKTAKVSFGFTPETKELLESLSVIHERSMTGVLEQLIKRDAREKGLVQDKDHIKKSL